MKEISRGAEAIIYADENSVRKERPKKKYRHPLIDAKIRKLRTRHEARIINRVAEKGVNTPKIKNVDEENGLIEMEFIKGRKIRDILTGDKRSINICEKIGEGTAMIHANNIIHGDLTTSNMILRRGRVVFIDFGLAYYSEKIEDRAVDLHLLKRALESKHWRSWEKLFDAVVKGYVSKGGSKEVLTRMEKVESRGRYRHDKRKKK